MTVPTPRSTAVLERGEVDRLELLPGDLRDALVDGVRAGGGRAVLRAAVADEVLGGGQDLVVAVQVLAGGAALQALDDRLHGLDERRVLTVATRRSGPSARRGSRRGRARSPTGCRWRGPRSAVTAPVLSASFGSRVGTDADVVRHDRRADDVVVAVHRVHAVDQRDLEPGRLRPELVGVDHLRPRLGRVRRRDGAAAGEQRAEVVRGDVAACDLSALRSAWVIWPAFSASDIRDRRSATRFFTGQLRVEVRAGRGRR